MKAREAMKKGNTTEVSLIAVRPLEQKDVRMTRS